MPDIQFNFSWIDDSVVILYFILVLYIGFVVSNRNKKNGIQSKTEFLLAGRRLTLPIFVATLVATWYGNILGVGEFVYKSGLVAWVCFGLPYYIAAALFAAIIAKKVRLSNVHTIPEQISKKYGNLPGWISSIIVLIISIPAAYILMIGIIIRMFTGLELWLCIIIGASLSLAYLFTGGFKADILTNTAQFIMMYLGFGVLLYFTIQKFGMPSLMLSKLPALHKELFGGNSWQFVLAWYIIALQTFVDPSFHQRSSAAKSPNTAQRGIYISIIFWVIFDSMTLFAGLYARVFFNSIEPVMAFPVLGNFVLPTFWKGFFVVAMLSSIMAALDSYAFISAATIGNDIIASMLKKAKFKVLSSKTLTNIGLLITAIIGVIMAIALPSAIQLIFKTASIAVPALILPLLLSFSSKFLIEKRKIVILMVCSTIISTIWTFTRISGENHDFIFRKIFMDIEPMMAGIIVTMVLGIMFIRRVKKIKI